MKSHNLSILHIIFKNTYSVVNLSANNNSFYNIFSFRFVVTGINREDFFQFVFIAYLQQMHWSRCLVTQKKKKNNESMHKELSSMNIVINTYIKGIMGLYVIYFNRGKRIYFFIRICASMRKKALSFFFIKKKKLIQSLMKCIQKLTKYNKNKKNTSGYKCGTNDVCVWI